MVMLRSGQETLIQTNQCSIIYGNFRDNPDTELFRCDRRLDNTDLVRYIKENRCIVGFEEEKGVTELRHIEGKQYVGYYRLYFRDGWYGRWMELHKHDKIELDCTGIDKIVTILQKFYPNGCDWKMKEDLSKNFDTWGNQEHRYLLKPFKNDLYRIMIDTTYGNHDYPVRIYVYKDMENN